MFGLTCRKNLREDRMYAVEGSTPGCLHPKKSRLWRIIFFIYSSLLIDYMNNAKPLGNKILL